MDSYTSLNADTNEQDTLYNRRGLAPGFEKFAEILKQDGSVLDVGCGPGSITIEAAGLVPEGRIVGVDAEPSAIRQAVSQAASAHLSNCAFQIGDVYNLPFEDAEYDLTYCSYLFEWLDHPLEALKEMKRVTKPGGTVAARNNDLGARIIYPTTPALEKWQQNIGHFSTMDNHTVFGDRRFGRRLYSIFVDAGLSGIDLSVVSRLSGKAEMEHFYFNRLVDLLNPDVPAGIFTRKMIDDGLFTTDLAAQARAELDGMRSDPHFVHTVPTFVAFGRVT